MRIRRRPPQPSPPQAASDPTTTSTAPQTPRNAARCRGWLDPCGGGDREAAGDEPPRAGADLARQSGVARRLALPQDDNVRSMGSAQHELGADDDDGGHRRLSTAVSNGRHSLDQKDGVACINGVGVKSEPVEAMVEEQHVTSNGTLTLAVVPAAVAVKDDEKKKASSNGNGSGSGGAKKQRRGPAVLLEGSRCSRVNGRGWRCSQPTLVGYSLCEHHLGKGRMRSAAAAAAARGRLGRTEHVVRAIPVAVGAAAAVTIAAAPPPPKAEAPSLPPC